MPTNEFAIELDLIYYGVGSWQQMSWI